MRSRLLACILLFAAPALADEIVLKDGRTITTRKPYTVKGKQAIVTQADGTLIALPLSEIDKEKTAAAMAKSAQPPPVATPAPKPVSAADAARIKNSRKATVVLKDDDIAHSLGGSGDSREEGEGKIEVGGVSTTRTRSGYSVTGSLSNTGKTDALGITLAIEAIGENNKTVATVFGMVAKDTLEAGEKTAFTAEVVTDATMTNFRYVPRWAVKPRGTLTQGSQPGGEANAPAPAPAAEGERTPEDKKPAPAPPRTPDYAAPTGNAPVGAPTTPGGTYLPKPSPEGQPKQPGS